MIFNMRETRPHVACPDISLNSDFRTVPDKGTQASRPRISLGGLGRSPSALANRSFTHPNNTSGGNNSCVCSFTARWIMWAMDYGSTAKCDLTKVAHTAGIHATRNTRPVRWIQGTRHEFPIIFAFTIPLALWILQIKQKGRPSWRVDACVEGIVGRGARSSI